MFGDFETWVKKEAVREVAVENYDIFFSREEIWFCLNRKKSFDITKALIVGNNLEKFKMLQTNDNISKSQNSEFWKISGKRAKIFCLDNCTAVIFQFFNIKNCFSGVSPENEILCWVLKVTLCEIQSHIWGSKRIIEGGKKYKAWKLVASINIIHVKSFEHIYFV